MFPHIQVFAKRQKKCYTPWDVFLAVSITIITVFPFTQITENPNEFLLEAVVGDKDSIREFSRLVWMIREAFRAMRSASDPLIIKYKK
jgi:hypothetical protein